jgi:hypothetical protein
MTASSIVISAWFVCLVLIAVVCLAYRLGFSDGKLAAKERDAFRELDGLIGRLKKRAVPQSRLAGQALAEFRRTEQQNIDSRKSTPAPRFSAGNEEIYGASGAGKELKSHQ